MSASSAKDKCDKIEDKEEQLKCIQEKVEETQKKITSTGDKIQETQNKIAELSGQLSVTQSELQQVRDSIVEISNELAVIKTNLTDTRTKLADKISFRNNVLRTYSKKSVFTDIEMFFPTTGNGEDSPGTQRKNGFQNAAWLYTFNKKLSDETLRVIGTLNSEITQLETDEKDTEELKKGLESTQANLLTLTNNLASKKSSEEDEADKLEEKRTGYEQELEELQDKVLSIKSSMENGTVGDYEKVGAKTPEPTFSPAFGAFSYGAYTHYKGMSQYGAKARAKDDKDYKDIIEFYYGEDVDKKDDFPGEICVQGYGNMSFQKYLYGIAEMPSDWPEDALKAQAIAARSYAYRYQKKGSCICTTQSCQVFLKSKSDNPPSKWKEAVDDTKGRIVDGGVVAYYSATTGGYIENIGWDIDGGSWPGNAYEKKAGSPWFYKAWYTKSYSDGSTCGHDHPWLKEKEMADIINSWVVYTKGSGSEKSHITPTTTSCWGGDPYSLEKMAEKADKYGDKYSSVSSVDVSISNGGYTSEVILKTDKGTVKINGDTFKTVFNLRAPGYVAIRSRLYDLEKRD
jgi:peptidoglycan hydrolase-like amidase/predicted  nucleic acid-binding Zn-ribbon protein